MAFTQSCQLQNFLQGELKLSRAPCFVCIQKPPGLEQQWGSLAVPAVTTRLKFHAWQSQHHHLSSLDGRQIPTNSMGRDTFHSTRLLQPGLGQFHSPQHHCERSQNENCKSQLSGFKFSLCCFVSGSKKSRVPKVQGYPGGG